MKPGLVIIRRPITVVDSRRRNFSSEPFLRLGLITLQEVAFRRKQNGNIIRGMSENRSSDKGTRQSAGEVLSGSSRKNLLSRLLPFLGPAFIASVAYMDPGNFAANLQGGAQFGYTLLWVVVASNLMAMVVQTLSAKLGIATGRNLAELCRESFPRPVVIALWVLMEIVAMATDLAEFIGAAVGFNLLLGIPIWLAGLLTAAATIIILGLERYGFRPLEAVITSLVGVIAVCYLIETVLDRPDWSNVLFHAVAPQFSGPESVLLAAGILGATVMPHAIFLHSALTQGRIMVKDPAQLRRLYLFERIDVLIAMSLAGLINAAMLIMAASTFHRSGMAAVGTLEQAHATLEPLLGPAAGAIFALSLLAAGLSSSSVGTMAGQVIMQGFIHRRIQPWIRRLATMGPSLIVILAGWEPTRVLVISQVMLSFGLPFAILPLAYFSSKKSYMGVLVNRRITTAAVWMISGLIIALNGYLLYAAFAGGTP
jgi:manganese transport protein